jgi:hypothetical protein
VTHPPLTFAEKLLRLGYHEVVLYYRSLGNPILG